MRPFEGLRVLDFTRVVSGPYCTQMLGYLGAEVIKVEDRAGDAVRGGAGDAALKKEGLAATYIMFNAGKQSMTLDLKKPEAREIITKLVKTADVVVENFRAGVMERLGFGYQALLAHNPKLVYCSISGFGQTGPEAKTAAFDGNIQAMSGMMAVSGEVEGPPMRAGYSVGDTSTGLNATIAICAAIYQRDRTGQGQYIDVAMLDCAISLMSQTVGPWLNGRVPQKRRANLSINFEPTADVYQTADGAMQLAVMRDDHVKDMMKELGLGHLADDPRLASREVRVANTAFIRAEVQAKFLERSTAEWQQRMGKAGLPCAPVLDLPDALTQPQVQHRGLVEETVDEKTGSVMRRLNAPFQFAHDGPRASGPPARLGEHTDTILASLGYGKDEIAALHAAQVV
jgi:crotonobetainyl-CoA:carnitine CoA-transferase CaiB-like acyl-CoA transferase